MNLFAPHITDGYKIGHPKQLHDKTESITSNFTPRDFSYAVTTPKTDKMVFVGLQYAVKEYLINSWNTTFFSQPKEKVISRYSRRIAGYLGSGEGINAIEMMSKLHDLGYLPIRINALREGSRVNAGIPVFVLTNTHPDFGPLVNYLETVLSNTVWPMCNSASLMEQYYLLASHYGELSGASSEFWLPFAIHNFAMRGHRGVEDSIISAFGHSLFHKGTDTFSVIDFVEEYYNANSNIDFVGGSVNASEHATVCQQIAINGGGHVGEVAALRHFLTEIYPTGIFSYVSDSRDYWDVIGNIARELKDVIVSRGVNQNNQPGVLTFRPDSSVDTPYEVLLGYKLLEVNSLTGDDAELFSISECNSVLYNGVYYKARIDNEYHQKQYLKRIELGREMTKFEVQGTLQTLWDIFGGTEVDGAGINPAGRSPKYKLLDSHVRVIYGEAISLDMGNKIYQGMVDDGWCVGNVFFGVGSWAFIGNSSRDSYGIACKATNSVVDGIDVPLQKDPKGTSSFKKSARGRLMVNKIGDDFVLRDNVTRDQEATGELVEFFLNGKIVNEQNYSDIVNLLK